MVGTIFIYRPNWIKIYGEQYHRGEFVHMGWQQNDLPEFGKLLDIIIAGGFPFFQVEKYETVGINSHILGYLIRHSYTTTCVHASMLPYKNTFTAHSYIADRRLYIVLKSHLEQFTM